MNSDKFYGHMQLLVGGSLIVIRILFNKNPRNSISFVGIITDFTG